MASLYELSAQAAEFLDAYDCAETEEERMGIVQSMLDMQGEIDAKADDYARLRQIKIAEAKAFKDEAKRLSDRAKAAENLADRLCDALLDAMKMTGRTEIKTSIGKWKIQMNPLSCEVLDVDAVPIEYHIRQEDKIDRKGLIQRYKETGEVVPGVEFKQEQGIRFR